MKSLNLRRTIVCVLSGVLVLSLLLFGCGRKENPQIPSSEQAVQPAEVILASDLGILHETEFGGVYLDLTIDEFNALGAQYGDSVDIRFSNGYLLEDIPYYNGYYTKTGMPILVAYPGYPFIRAGFNNGPDLWVIAELEEDDTAVITLHEKAKYLSVQQARAITYSDDRAEFPDDATFANFRALSGGKLKENLLYRSASPADNQHNRAPYVEELAEEAGIRCIVDLADNDDKIAGYLNDQDFHPQFFETLYLNGDVIPLAMGADYSSETFMKKAALGCVSILEHEGPYLIHCTEGKDRTGFMCLLIEALAGASYEEILSDYMITYDNYYQINQNEQTDKYETIITDVLNPMVELLVPGEDIETADLLSGAKGYLASGGMTEEEIALFIDLITE